MNFFDYLEKDKYLKLNDQQKKAVSFDRGNALVLSTAGSGKTTVIVSRAGRLLYEKKCSEKILTITFSKMAATDMKNRFDRVFGDEFRYKTDFSTIHSFSYKIVRDYCKKTNKNITLIDSNYKILEEILKDIYKSSYFNTINEEEIENIASKISYAKNMLINPDNFEENGIKINNFRKIYDNYELYKRKNQLMDFDDMLHFGYNILSQIKYYNDLAKDTYQYIQIDEMQDTSKIQHEIIKQISNDNLFMVGDDDQSIYSFRGSYPDFMLNFNYIYPDGKVFYLNNNYRSDKHIVLTAKKFIENNTFRYKKAIETNNMAINEVSLVKIPDRKAQCKYIINDIKNHPNKSIGILYRYNISSLIIANGLYENNIEFFIKDDKTKFFKNTILYDVLAFLKLSLDTKDRESFSRIYYKSYTYFTRKMCNFVVDYEDNSLSVFEILRRYPNLEYYSRDKIESFKNDINYLVRLKPEDTIRFIKYDLEYMSYVEKMCEDGRNNMTSSMLILEIIEEIAKYCKDTNEFIYKISNLQKVLTNASQNYNQNITLSSVHSSKGLEYDIVYLIDNIDGEFPVDRKNETELEYKRILEEERRIFYVGMTRARERLTIFAPGTPSLFINELTSSVKNNNNQSFSIGQLVKHKKFGEGRIIDLDDKKVTVKFKNSKVVILDLGIVKENRLLS